MTDNVISKIHYVTLQDLRQNNFQMPWEGTPLMTPVEDGTEVAPVEEMLPEAL